MEERKRAALLAVERHDRVARAYGHDAASACRSVDLGEGLEATGGVTWRKLSTQDRQRLLDLTDGNMSGHYGHKWEEERTGKGRVSIILWGQADVVDEAGSPPHFTDPRSPHFSQHGKGGKGGKGGRGGGRGFGGRGRGFGGR